MKKEEVFDINGKNPKVGDRIALAVGWTTNNAYLNVCVIDEIIEKPITVEMRLSIERTGLWNELTEFTWNRKKVIKFPMSHCKFIIL